MIANGSKIIVSVYIALRRFSVGIYSGKRLAVFGDSIINGSGNNDYGVGEFLRDGYGFTLLKYCVGGARTGFNEGKSWIVDQVKDAIKAGIGPDVIIFDGFTNDCNMTDGVNCDVPLGTRGAVKDIYDITAEDDFTTCFESIVSAFGKHFKKADIIFVRPHLMGRRDREAQRVYGDRAAEICRDYGIKIADIYNDSKLDTFDAEMRDRYTNDSYGWGRGDCTHPNEEGYKRFYLPIILNQLEGNL